MKEVRQIAAEYAVAQTNEVMSLAIAKAYEDGYRDGYRDRDEELPVDTCTNITEFVDLGLPSGTLWAADYEKEDGKIKYLPYDKASAFSIPTEEQWKELFNICRFECWSNDIKWGESKVFYYFVGPNGNRLQFEARGRSDGELIHKQWNCYCWILEQHEKAIKLSGRESRPEWNIIDKQFGYKMPIRLVRNKL